MHTLILLPVPEKEPSHQGRMVSGSNRKIFRSLCREANSCTTSNSSVDQTDFAKLQGQTKMSRQVCHCLVLQNPTYTAPKERFLSEFTHREHFLSLMIPGIRVMGFIFIISLHWQSSRINKYTHTYTQVYTYTKDIHIQTTYSEGIHPKGEELLKV